MVTSRLQVQWWYRYIHNSRVKWTFEPNIHLTTLCYLGSSEYSSRNLTTDRTQGYKWLELNTENCELTIVFVLSNVAVIITLPHINAPFLGLPLIEWSHTLVPASGLFLGHFFHIKYSLRNYLLISYLKEPKVANLLTFWKYYCK